MSFRFYRVYPTFGLLAAAERRFKGGVNTVVTAEKWRSFENDYVALGALRYLGDNCVIETGRDGEQAATAIFGVRSTVSISTQLPRRIWQRAIITSVCAARLRLSLSVSKRDFPLRR
jgi:hypothetical protein